MAVAMLPDSTLSFAVCSLSHLRDRILGMRLGVAATDLVANGQFGRMVCLKAGKMASVSLDEALEKNEVYRPFQRNRSRRALCRNHVR